jgi:hypothetical protein
VKATSKATQMMKSKSMKMVHAIQGDVNKVVFSVDSITKDFTHFFHEKLYV